MASSTSKIIVLISGGNAGIGYEIVKKLATEHGDTHHILMGTRDLSRGEAALKKLGSPECVSAVQLEITSDESIDACVEHVQSTYGKLDILINNAGTAGNDMPGGREAHTVRERYTYIYNVNTISAVVLTEKFITLLSKSSLPKIIFISSSLGSIELVSNGTLMIPVPDYNSSKTAMNYHAAYYAKKYPDWKVNTICPGYNATKLNDAPLTEETDPKNGAIRCVEVVLQGKDGETGTYSNKKQGVLPW